MGPEFIDELVTMPPAELDELLRQTELECRNAEQRLAMIASVVEQKSQFLVDGHASMSAYLKAQINCSGATANRIRRRGRLLDRHPAHDYRVGVEFGCGGRQLSKAWLLGTQQL